MSYYIVSIIIGGLSIFLLIYKIGKNAKSNEIIKENEKLRKKYGKKKYSDIQEVIDSL